MIVKCIKFLQEKSEFLGYFFVKYDIKCLNIIDICRYLAFQRIELDIIERQILILSDF